MKLFEVIYYKNYKRRNISFFEIICVNEPSCYSLDYLNFRFDSCKNSISKRRLGII
jgi:hypothetical protein